MGFLCLQSLQDVLTLFRGCNEKGRESVQRIWSQVDCNSFTSFLGTLIPRKEVEVVETIRASIVQPSQALRLRARKETKVNKFDCLM